MTAPTWKPADSGKSWEYVRGDHLLGVCWSLSNGWEAAVYHNGRKVASVFFENLDDAQAMIQRETRELERA